MTKLSKQDKIDIYNKWKYYGISCNQLAKEYNIKNNSNISYLVRLIDKYSLRVLEVPYTKYSVEFKEAAIKRALSGKELVDLISLDLALPNSGMLHNWIRKYKEDGYNVINHKKGKPSSNGQERSNNSQASRTTSQAKKRELETYYPNRIYKKIRCLSGRKAQKPEAQELASAVTELRRELHVTVDFILETINSNPDLPHLSRSNYYYTINKIDKDEKNRDIMQRIKDIFEEHKHRYGYRRITAQLRREGLKINHKKVKTLND